ncbi:MAG: hypothetical protein JWO82_572 [Akkermansiaceae bacterium]|nr:hypothetical protein [Akkermansiaceae bacterium]
MSSFLFHPATTFVVGAVIPIVVIGILLNSCTPPNTSAATVGHYKDQLSRSTSTGPAPDSRMEKEGIERFTRFLQNVNKADYIRENTSKVYAPDAFLNDTLATHHGAAEIEAYFLKTAESLQEYNVTIDDVARSGSDHYIRWTMVLTAKALSGGTPVHSTGISQVRLNSAGQVVMHQDFWDSGENFFGKLPVAGGVIGFIRKRLQ